MLELNKELKRCVLNKFNQLVIYDTLVHSTKKVSLQYTFVKVHVQNKYHEWPYL